MAARKFRSGDIEPPISASLEKWIARTHGSDAVCMVKDAWKRDEEAHNVDAVDAYVMLELLPAVINKLHESKAAAVRKSLLRPYESVLVTDDSPRKRRQKKGD